MNDNFRIFHANLHFVRMNIDVQCRCIHGKMKDTERETMHHKKGFISFFESFGYFFGFDIPAVNIIVFIISVRTGNRRSSDIAFDFDSILLNHDGNDLIGCILSVNPVNHFF